MPTPFDWMIEGEYTSRMICLPWPPSANQHWRTTAVQGRPRTYLTHEAKQFRSAVMAAVVAEGFPKFGHDRLRVAIVLQPDTLRRFDIDNRIKPVLDALEACGVFDDDEQIDELFVFRGKKCDNACCTVTITVLKGEL